MLFRLRTLLVIATAIVIAVALWRWQQRRASLSHRPPRGGPPATPFPPSPPPSPGAARQPVAAWTRQNAPLGANVTSVPESTTARLGSRPIKTRVHKGAPPAQSNQAAAEQPAEQPVEQPAEQPVEAHEEQTKNAAEQPDVELLERAVGKDKQGTDHIKPPVRPDAGPAKASLGTPSESQPEEPEQGAPSTTPDSPETPRLLNINTASVEALIELPGIGPSLAQRIVAYRETHGPFQTIEALIDVQGIGPNNFAEFAHLITVEE